MNDCNPFRPRSEAGLWCHHHGRFRVRLLSSDFPAPAGAFCPNPVRMRLRIWMHPIQVCPRSASGPCGSDRWPWATGLVSYPSSHVFGSHAADSLLGSLPRIGSYCVSVVIAGVSGAFLAECSIRGSPDPFSTFRLRHRTVSAAGFVRSKPPDDGPPHWLTVVTDRSCMTDCVRPRFRNHGTGGMTRLRGWFVGSVPLVCRITEPSPLAAWLPDRCRGNGTTHPEEAGDMCLRDSHSE
jgi:hypothetical protein